MTTRPIQTSAAPTPAGHYSQGVVHGGVIYLSAQLPKNEDGALAEGVTAQTRQLLSNLDAVLRGGGSDLTKLLRVTVYLTRIEDWGAMDQAFAEVLGPVKPARSVVVVAELKSGVLVSMDAIAAIDAT